MRYQYEGEYVIIKDMPASLLPYDGDVQYFGKIFSESHAKNIFLCLEKEIFWKHDELFIYGKRIVTKRKVAWHGEQDFSYTYSKQTKKALPFTPCLLEIKKHVESITNQKFNSCLLNFYHSGLEGMSWHRDAEKELKKEGAIASLSFGAQRRFCFKHIKTAQKIECSLENGSMLLMQGVTQNNWLHSLPVMTKVFEPRINLTFRTII